jgi:hypothetical protein
MNWYKIAQTNYPYSLLDIIRMQEGGLSPTVLDFWEAKEAKELEKNGFIKKTKKHGKTGTYPVYVINEEKFKQMGWSTKTGRDFTI